MGMTVPQLIAAAVGVNVLAAACIAMGIAWGTQRADVRHLTEGQESLVFAVAGLTEKATDTQASIARLEGWLFSSGSPSADYDNKVMETSLQPIPMAGPPL